MRLARNTKIMLVFTLLSAVIFALAGLGGYSVAGNEPGSTGIKNETGMTASVFAEPINAFSVHEQKYDYRDNDNHLVVLSVENQSDQSYTLTVKGQYLDENGAVLKEESQTLEGFSAGWQNHFFFAPEMPFDRFVYTIDAEEYAGTCFTNLFAYSWSFREITLVDVRKAVWETKMNTLALQNGKPVFPSERVFLPCLAFDLIHECTTGFSDYVCVWESVLFLNDRDEVIDIRPDWITGVYYPMDAGNKMGRGKEYYFFPDETDRTWPKDLTGDVTVLIAVTKASAYQPKA